ncbi:STAS domain-containing protein [Uliginosibacterium flavum]|uniref:STAS domain-containing protein n=1 Tax=Uliginosibacterium flavum TaxID=1396831 RepID=A0ABV2TLE0_9RHOO
MISERNGQLFIEGAMNQQTAPALLPAGEPLMAAADRIVNLSGITAVDSSALAVLLGWLRAAQAAGKTLHIVEAPGAFVSLASLYGVAPILFPSETDRDASVQH